MQIGIPKQLLEEVSKIQNESREGNVSQDDEIQGMRKSHVQEMPRGLKVLERPWEKESHGMHEIRKGRGGVLALSCFRESPLSFDH